MKKNTRKGFIYFRYILPILTPVIMLLLMHVPCYRFVTADEGLHQRISAWGLISNSWDTVREYLFGSTEQVQVTADFAGAVFGIIILLALLFCIGVAVAVYSAVTAFRFFGDGCKESRSRILFITLVPNRVVLCICYALILPLVFFPRMLPALYNGILNYYIELICEPFDIIIVDVILFAATVAVIFISARFERLAQMNLFFKHKKQVEEDDETEKEETDDETDAYGMMDRRAREEQNERILRLLNKSKENEQEKE